MKKIVRKTILFTNYVLAILLLLTYISIHVSPATFWPASFIGLAYPYIVTLNLLFVFFWIYFKKWYFIISLVTILLGWNYLSSFVQVKKRTLDPSVKSIKVLSYNIRMTNLYKHSKTTENKEKILAFINSEEPDIICFQEYYSTLKTTFEPPDVLKKYYNPGNSHIQKANTKNNYGLSIFSNYPIVKKGRVYFNNSLNFSIYADILIPPDTVRVYNIHLQSIRFREGDYQVMDSLQYFYNEKQFKHFLNISSKLRYAFIKRGEQADILAGSIKNSPYPVIICGDFNDTPVSFTYHTLLNDHKDSFIESGSGIGNTYIGKFPSFRIDYILHDKELTSYNYRKPNLRVSDHYPIICEIVID